MIPFGEFAPDQSSLNKNIATVAENVIPVGDKYKSINDLGTAQVSFPSLATTDGVKQAMYVDHYDNASPVLLTNIPETGDTPATSEVDEYIYRDGDLLLTDTTGNTEYYFGKTFVRWSDELLYIVGGNLGKIYEYNVTALDDVTPVANSSVTLTSGPPSCAARVRDFMVINNFDVTTSRGGVKWSEFNDPMSWTAGTNQSDSQALEGGEVIHIVGGEEGYIFQQETITRMTYVGVPTVFQFDKISDFGTLSGRSVVSVGDAHYFFAYGGFYVLQGNSIQSISANKIDDWFLSQVSGTEDALRDVCGAHDAVNGTIMWAYKSTDSTDDLDKALIYSIKTGRWSTLDFGIDTVRCIFPIPADSNFSLKDPAVAVISGAKTAMTCKHFDGSALAATLETGELSDGNRAQISSVRPLIDGTATVTLDTRNNHSETPSSTSATAVGASGRANFRTNARYHRIKCTTSGNFDHALGVEAVIRPRGRR